MRTRQKCVATDTWRSLGCRTTPLEHWSRRKPTVEPRWAKQQTKKLRPKPTKINSFSKFNLLLAFNVGTGLCGVGGIISSLSTVLSETSNSFTRLYAGGGGGGGGGVGVMSFEHPGFGVLVFLILD